MDGSFDAIGREPAYLKVCRAIEEKIASGELREGETIPTEAALSEQFHLTRSTVREGIRMLERTGLVERGPGKRLYVHKPNSGDVAQNASRDLAMSGATFLEVWEALYAVHPAMARYAAQRVDAKAIAAMRARREALKGAPPRDGRAIVAASSAFFLELARGLRNPVAEAILHSLDLLIEKSMERMMAGAPHAKARILAAQANIIDAIEARDGAAAERWMRRHIADLKRGYELAGLDANAPIE